MKVTLSKYDFNEDDMKLLNDSYRKFKLNFMVRNPGSIISFEQYLNYLVSSILGDYINELGKGGFINNGCVFRMVISK